MRVIIFLLAALSFCAHAQAQSPVFVKAIRECRWENGAFTKPNSVDLLVGETERDFVIQTPSGRRYLLPKTHAVKITAEEAALLLLAERSQKEVEIADLTDRLESAQQPITLPPAGSGLFRRPASGAIRQQTPEEANRWWQAEQQRQELERLRHAVENLRR